ncbi:hypothetical protein MASR2M69_13780 [Bacteroidota bacterium]
MDKEILDRVELARLIAQERIGIIGNEDKEKLNEMLQNMEYADIYKSIIERDIVSDRIVSQSDIENKYWKAFLNKILRKKSSNYWLWRAAAIVLLFLSIPVSILLLNRDKKEEVTLSEAIFNAPQKQNMALLVLSSGEKIEIENTTETLDVVSDIVPETYDGNELNKLIVPEYGRITVKLEDGTEVTINSESELEFPEKFNTDTREVWLKGEAFFNVKEDLSRKFIVHTGLGDVSVLGTNFNVDADSKREIMKTTLVTGKVRVDWNESVMMLSPGQQAFVDKANNISKVLDVDVNESVSWMYDKFYFSGKELSQITDQLSKWYKVQIDFENDALKYRHFTLEAKRYESIITILELLSETEVISYEVKDGKILIKE